jgi:hypothetical protein
MARAVVSGLVAVVLLAAGTLTHFAVRPGRLATADRSLMRMQRMGPPPYLQGAYEDLNSVTVAISAAGSGRVLATGIFAEDFLKLAKLPGFSSFLPTGVKHFLEVGGANTYTAVFVAPLQDITQRRLLVDTTSVQLPAVVIGTDQALGLAAIAASMSQSQMLGMYNPPAAFSRPPTGVVPLHLLVMRRNPSLHTRSAGFVLTSGGLRGGRGWCATPVSGADSGAPLGYVSPSGAFFLAGLALPGPVRDQCSILGSWNIDRFLLVLPSLDRGTKVAYLGVSSESTATARASLGYRGQSRGAYVVSVVPGSPAAADGFRSGDVVIGVGRHIVDSPAALRSAIRGFKPGTVHAVTFLRAGARHQIRVKFGSIALSEESG